MVVKLAVSSQHEANRAAFGTQRPPPSSRRRLVSRLFGRLSLLVLRLGPSSPIMPPQVISMKDIRRIMPSYDGIQRALAAHPGCHFGLVTKIGAQPKTRTLTTLYQTMHAKTKRVSFLPGPSSSGTVCGRS